jgi:hypothetical protein
MPKFTGVKCEECMNTKIDGDTSIADAVYEGRAERWKIVLVKNTGHGPLITLGAETEAPDLGDAHYLCSSACFFSHITRLLKLDPTAQHR